MPKKFSTEFVVLGPPVAKGRPRFSSRGKFVRIYTDSKTIQKEKEFLSAAMPFIPDEPLLGAIEVHLVFIKVKPSGYRKNDNKWVKKPDLDNFIKVVDCLNGYFWKDDRQIVKIVAEKKFGPVDMTEVMIREL